MLNAPEMPSSKQLQPLITGLREMAETVGNHITKQLLYQRELKFIQ